MGWGSWAVKESESEQDQDDVDTKCYSLTDQENFSKEQGWQFLLIRQRKTVKQVDKKESTSAFINCNDRYINMTSELLPLLLSRPHTKIF